MSAATPVMRRDANLAEAVAHLSAAVAAWPSSREVPAYRAAARWLERLPAWPRGNLTAATLCAIRGLLATNPAGEAFDRARAYERGACRSCGTPTGYRTRHFCRACGKLEGAK